MYRFFQYITRSWLWGILSLCFALIIVGGLGLLLLETQLPDTKTLSHVQLQVPLRVYSKDHLLMASFGDKRRMPVSLSQVPPQLIHAVLATEDRRYFEHPGVDLIGIFRATKAVLTTGRKVQGASTITMQVARNFFLTRKKTYTRKLIEILLALKIDHEFSKQEILELYLNKVYLGNRAYGVAAAAQVYYGKSLSQLSLPEMAMIGGLPQAPSSDNPITNPSGALARRNHVLQRMLEVNFINQQQYQQAIAAPITATYHAPSVQLNAPYVAEAVRQKVIELYGKEQAYNSGLVVTTTIDGQQQIAAQKALMLGLIHYSERHGYIASQQNLGKPDDSVRALWVQQLQSLPAYAPLQPVVVWSMTQRSIQVLTADNDLLTIPWSGLRWARKRLNPQLQLGAWPQQASDILSLGDVVQIRALANAQHKSATKPQDRRWRLSQIPQAQSAIVALDPDDGSVTAMVGGFSFSHNKFNRVTQAARQPGSVFKPFIYSAALAKGFTLASTINDAPVVLSDTGENILWRPHNVNLSFAGPTRLMVGLSESRNLVSIRLLQRIGINDALQYSRRFGFKPSQLPHALSLALGSASLSPLQIARGYAVFANGGFQVEPHIISTIKNMDDDQAVARYTAKHPVACEQCLQTGEANQPVQQFTAANAVQSVPADNVYLMVHALKNIILHGTGRAALVLKRGDLAGKTGSTNKRVDAWFAGFNRHLVTVVWVGFDNFQPLQEYGSQAALPIWIDFMRQALQGVPEKSLPRPKDIISMRIDPATGLLASPQQAHAMFELFRKHFAPQETADSSTGSDAELDPGFNAGVSSGASNGQGDARGGDANNGSGSASGQDQQPANGSGSSDASGSGGQGQDGDDDAPLF